MLTVGIVLPVGQRLQAQQLQKPILALMQGRAVTSVSHSHLPADFRLRLVVSAGMIPYYTQLEISIDNALFEEYDYHHHRRITWQPKVSQLEYLWQVLCQNHFEQITYQQVSIADRAGKSLFVQANGKSYQLHDAGMYLIDPQWREAFEYIVSAIQQVFLPDVEAQKHEVQFCLDPSLRQVDYWLKIFLQNRPAYEYGQTTLLPDTLHLRLLPGSYRLRVELWQQPKARLPLARQTFEFNLIRAQTYRIGYTNQQLWMKPEP